MKRGCKEEAAQRRLQGAGGDGGAFGGEDPGGAVGGIWGSSDDDQQLEAGAGFLSAILVLILGHNPALERSVAPAE